MANAWKIEGALLDGSLINRTAPVGSHDGKLYVIAFEQLRSNAFGGIGENWIRAFKSEDDGATWAVVGNSLRSSDGWLDACVDPRAAAPYVYITYFDVAYNHVVARFDMAAERFDIETHFISGAAVFSRTYIACNGDGEIRVAIADGEITLLPDNTYRHEITPYTIAFDGRTLAAGGNQPVPGITFPIGAYAFMGIAPAPAAGGHTEGARGWLYIIVEQYYEGADVRHRTVFFDDTGARNEFIDNTDARGRTGVRARQGAQEPFFLTYQRETSNYWLEAVSNDTGLSVQCSQSQIPTVTRQGVYPLSGGGAVVGRGGDAWVMWFDGAAWKARKASGVLSCAGLADAETLLTLDDAPPPTCLVGASSITAGIAMLYAANDVSPSELDDWSDVWYTLYPIGGGCPQPEVSTHECSNTPPPGGGGCDSSKQGYVI